MARKSSKKAYLKGYEDGLNEAWDDVVKLSTKGYTMSEFRIMAKSRKATIHQKVDGKSREIESLTFEEIEAEEPGEIRELRKGGKYLIREAKPERSLDVFSSLTREVGVGLGITRIHPGTIERKCPIGGAELIWLTKAEGGKETFAYLSPTNLVGILSSISKFLTENKGSPVLLEGVEYLITQNSFDATLRFMQKVNEYVTLNEGILLVPVNPSTMSSKDYQLLAREMTREF
ncbi:MAG: DUF835 domain-containing protein [Thermoplasmata archaeon]